MPLLLALALLTASPAAAAEPESWDALLTEVSGEVTLNDIEVEEGMPLEDGDQVKTGPDSSAELSLDGGSVILLDENSHFTLASSKKSATELTLAFGRLLAKVKSLLAGQNLRVRTPCAVAAVRGTEFAVEAEPGGPGLTHVGVFEEGLVEVAGLTGPPQQLGPGQETSAARDQAALAAAPLKRFLRHRKAMKSLRKRFQSLAKRWKALTPERRRELRQELRSRRPGAGRPSQRRRPPHRRPR